MRKRHVRWGFKLSLPVNLILMLLIWLDYSSNASRNMWPLLFAYGAFLVLLLMLFFARPRRELAVITDAIATNDEPSRLTIAERP